ncbi:PLP-dependent aspartate aminotransferase family protein [Faecalibacter sp. LW9]|uniref:trans-sulfuration enzyme family protein n=1 Tax=Faecalibacter sp. LW9 TaxID=3103144 RepID=UPI002AFE166E|nr:PLP-dependent aspartate aminotransferase family protein [Faecalibacter sp. LW9]
MSKATQILHSIPVDQLTGSISVPVYQTSTFVQEVPGLNKGFDYARSNNPTRMALEDIIAQLEGGHSAYAFATGLAAIDAIVKLLKAGDEIVAVDDIYGGAYRLFTQVYEKLGIKIHFVDTSDATNIIDFITERTKLVWLESPTNPTLKISDIETIANIAHVNGALVVVDNTFASPVAQNPIALGADFVVHSGTKYIAGHSDLVAGIVVAKTKELGEKIKFIQNATGGILGPWDCFLTIRGIETLELRYERISSNALELAQFLKSIPQIDQVYYPGLIDHKNHNIAKKQQNNLFGGIISFTLKVDTVEAAVKVVTSTHYFKLAESLGGAKSLLCHPAQMTHASVPREKRLRSGVQDSLIRLSVGIENVEDLKQDIEQAIAQLKFVNV